MRSVACLVVFAVLCLSAVSALESVSSEQALDILDTLESSPEVLTQRKLLQSGPLSHQLAVCRAEALQGKLCPIIAHYLKVCRKKFGIHTLKCSATSATACTSMVKYGISSSGRCVCNIGYEHLGPNCVACPPGKVKNTIAYAYCKLCAKGKYQPKAGQATCLKCDIKTHRVNLGKPHPRSMCTLRSSSTTPTPTKKPTKPPTKTPSPTKTPTKAPTAGPTVAPTVSPTTSSPPPGPSVKAPPSPVSMSPPPAPLGMGK